MLQTNDPQAWHQLLMLIAERVADDIIANDGSDQARVLRDVESLTSKDTHHARNHLRSVQLRQAT